MKCFKKYIFIACLLSLNPFSFIHSENAPETDQNTRGQSPTRYQKKYTLFVYMAVDNNLARYALNNIEQMLPIGSNQYINIVVQINTPGNNNPTQRYFIEKGKKTLIQTVGQAPTQKLNSGHPQTLIDGVAWAMKYYPADNLILNMWNHGSGVHDRKPSDTFDFSDELQIDNHTNEPEILTGRGICFDDTFRSYISNQELKRALQEIQTKILHGKKIAVIWLEACLMSMIEIASIFKDHADYVVSSENVEYAPGSNYQLVLSAFSQRVPSPREFACHIVNSFDQAFALTRLPYTQSAIDLSKIKAVEDNLNLIAQQLVIAIQDQRNKSVTKVLQKCKTRPLCTTFHEPSYIDLRHFYANLQTNMGQISLMNLTKESIVKGTLLRLLDQGISLINNAVIANATGSSMKSAGGISIYFPEHGILNSYLQSQFAQSNSWSTMLMQYILQNK